MPNENGKYLCGKDNTDMTAAVVAARKEPSIPLPTGASPDAEGDGTAHVRLQCTDEQWCDFRGKAAPGTTVYGTPVPKKEVDRWTAWQGYADPIEGMKRLDGYSNWVLAANAIVVLLASGLVSKTALPEPGTTFTKVLFGLAVVALGCSWVFISLAKAPAWGRLNRHSPKDYLTAFSQALQRRRRLFAWAAGLLGVSLALAALIPLAQSLKGQAHPPPVRAPAESAQRAGS